MSRDREYRLVLRPDRSEGNRLELYNLDGSAVVDSGDLSEKLQIRLTATMYAELCLFAELTNRRPGDVIRMLLVDYLRPGTAPPPDPRTITDLLTERAAAIEHNGPTRKGHDRIPPAPEYLTPEERKAAKKSDTACHSDKLRP